MESESPPERAPGSLRRTLLAFYDAHQRDLPWRRTDDPYAIWVSEIMLQQTRVETVIPYYERWLERFPSVDTLADADEETVLEAWTGLGYYRRARNLHRAALHVREVHQGKLPDTYDGLRDLPGVGAYTAGAVSSIAFGEVRPAVDGNVKRVLARLDDEAAPSPRDLERRAAALVDPDRPGDFNQALMELGATVCTPRNPVCDACPWEPACLARARGTQHERPQPVRARAVPTVVKAVAVLVLPDERTVLTRRPVDGLLGGMWEFPATELPGAAERATPVPDQLVEAARNRLLEHAPALDPVRLHAEAVLAPVRHRFSHLAAAYHPVVFRLDSWPEDGPESVSFSALDTMAVPVAQQRIAAAAREFLARTD